MATTSQKIIEIKFFVRIRGALTPPPIILVPVTNIPLLTPLTDCFFTVLADLISSATYHAAPTTLSPIHSAIPSVAHVYGDVSSKNRPTWAPQCQSGSSNYRLFPITRRVGCLSNIKFLSIIVEQHIYKKIASVSKRPQLKRPTRSSF